MHKATASLIHHPGSADWKGEGIDMEREGVGVRDSWLSGPLNGPVRAGESALALQGGKVLKWPLAKGGRVIESGYSNSAVSVLGIVCRAGWGRVVSVFAVGGRL